MKKILTLCAVLIAITLLVSTAQATTTVNNDPDLYNHTKWELDTWGDGGHSYTFSDNSYAFTYINQFYEGMYDWGNTEYQQAYDIFSDHLYGSSWSAGVIPLTTANQKIIYSAKLYPIMSSHWYAQGNGYINLWIRFSTGTGSYGYQYAEIIIYTHQVGLYTIGVGSYETATVSDGGKQWYRVGYHASQLSTSSYNYVQVNVNQIINYFQTTWGVNVGLGAIVGMTFGVEAVGGSIGATYNYVYYQY